MRMVMLMLRMLLLSVRMLLGMDAVEVVVGDGDEADGDIRIIGLKTTSYTASFTPAATTTCTRRAGASAVSTSPCA